ncbi:MAG: 16S rRNA (guanine(527)-N(7))-methyltransferase RsmG [Clostridiales bacterium]|jgi:16S rRNA (guanine527-N7)-methyltransferase|nr:16S rRNA (guanine(527)-N(7))-methyltransferase RsmG [Clostridiales bacterium]
MENERFTEALVEGAKELNVSLDEKQARAFLLYAETLIEWSGRMNLTALKDMEGILHKHFLDSLTAVPYIQDGMTVADVGSGAGFPGIPIKIAMPGVRLTLMDSTKKKLVFLDHMIDLLQLDNTKTVHCRAEDAGRDPAHRERYSAAVSRAVGRMDLLAEYCVPLVKPGGVFIAMKGPNAQEELADAVELIERLGGRIGYCDYTVIKSPINQDMIERQLIIIEKYRQTPAKYPRTSPELAKIHKKG